LDVPSGTVKWFNNQKGYGFIAPDTGGKDVFVHISAVEKAGYDGLPDGAKITYEIISDRGWKSALEVRPPLSGFLLLQMRWLALIIIAFVALSAMGSMGPSGVPAWPGKLLWPQ
jgi:CspA family cold shock protein